MPPPSTAFVVKLPAELPAMVESMIESVPPLSMPPPPYAKSSSMVQSVTVTRAAVIDAAAASFSVEVRITVNRAVGNRQRASAVDGSTAAGNVPRQDVPLERAAGDRGRGVGEDAAARGSGRVPIKRATADSQRAIIVDAAAFAPVRPRLCCR